MVFSLGKFPLRPWAPGSFLVSFLLVQICLVLFGGPWSTWTWVRYRNIIDLFRFFCILISTWTNTACLKGYLLFSAWIFLFVKYKVTVGVWVLCLVISSVPLLYLHVTVLLRFSIQQNHVLVSPEVQDTNSLGSILLMKIVRPVLEFLLLQ